MNVLNIFVMFGVCFVSMFKKLKWIPSSKMSICVQKTAIVNRYSGIEIILRFLLMYHLWESVHKTLKCLRLSKSGTQLLFNLKLLYIYMHLHFMLHFIYIQSSLLVKIKYSIRNILLICVLILCSLMAISFCPSLLQCQAEAGFDFCSCWCPQPAR